MTDSAKQVSIADFQVGQVLPGDIVDDEGKVLFRQGLKLSENILAAWQRRGAGPFFMREHTGDQPTSAPVSVPTAIGVHYSQNSIARINQWIDDTVQELNGLVEKLQSDQFPTLSVIEACMDEYALLLNSDPTAIAYCVLRGEKDDQNENAPARRCAYMAALAGVVGQAYGLSHDDSARTCLAALLHDLALFPGILEKIQDSFETEDERQSVVVRHGYFSCDLLNARTGLPEIVRIVMQQVHEQMDGTGYPRNIPGHVINVMARLINIVDAFLTLTAAGNCGAGFVPADAIAYLVHHTSRGAFDREAMLAFIKIQTMYGIGSRVVLDDGRSAVVLRSVESNPLRPIVEIEDASNDQPKVAIDLTQTQLNIVKPLEDERFAHRTRMAKSQMSEILWQQYNSLNTTAVSLF